MALYLCCLALFLTGLFCVAVKRNAVKMIMGIIIMDYALVIFIAVLGFGRGHVDSGLQALLSALLAAGSAVTIILIAMALRLYQRFGTFYTDKMRKLKG